MSQNANIYIPSRKIQSTVNGGVTYAWHAHASSDRKEGVGVEGLLGQAQGTLGDQFLFFKIEIDSAQGHDFGDGRFAVANDDLFTGSHLAR